MKTVEFRAWDIKRKEMYIIDDLYFFEEEGIHEIVDGIARGHHAEYKIMQYTGLKDKNGKKIFEGDIVRLTNSRGFHCLAEVQFVYGCFEVVFQELLYVREGLRGYYRERDYVKCFTCNHAIEVIGNIYEDQELLKN
ncbi:phage uncharacterized protein TIGR01671 [Bacillus sp. 491mf]|uniref:YopX family protein n=1 Tax=Bacillus TaxID=1386 RepID=UPI00068AC696|nr:MULTISPECIES: YopX family protein [unclassified Bacillus (in: firmicutes)]SFB99843.1 phage uncharacterized protein TIGR01671 [Bacillus sp. 491mf]